MPTFSVNLRLNEDAWDAIELACAGETEAIEAGREALQARLDQQSGPVGHGAAGVGIGSLSSHPERVVWLGEWEWSPVDGWFWQSSD